MQGYPNSQANKKSIPLPPQKEFFFTQQNKKLG